ncbi:hypothetical protein [Pseudomarimonas salicorniae]|uniref:WD40-like Beta Propeller Repeat n=1 Tax=Pseudomarimonas salicorniae TaxID=2933270 RepID=A0ABT0GG19_9GAMM|nr:hypothetical protein [Lysobacter sp. CAU 1642]MCK7593484.1 hypothetical protein [Lysobacter sp. CAU 1642]
MRRALFACSLILSLPVLAESPGEVRRIGDGISTPRNEYNLSERAEVGLRVFARSDADFANSRIWLSRRVANGWSAPVEAPITDPRYRDSDPWLSVDGRSLYFVSDRPAAGRGAERRDLDLWRLEIDAEGRWGPPQHLGETINSPGYELGPELHGGVLYFNSARPGGPAGLSLYQASQADDGSFPDPAQPLPAPFNSGKAQGDFTLSPDGRIALFWSIRDGRADGDLFSVRREGEGWADSAERLPAPFNSPGFDYTPAFSADGRRLFLASDRIPAEAGGEGGVQLSDLYEVDAAALR